MRKKENNKSMEMKNKSGRDKVDPRTQHTDLVECERNEAVCRAEDREAKRERVKRLELSCDTLYDLAKVFPCCFTDCSKVSWKNPGQGPCPSVGPNPSSEKFQFSPVTRFTTLQKCFRVVSRIVQMCPGRILDKGRVLLWVPNPSSEKFQFSPVTRFTILQKCFRVVLRIVQKCPGRILDKGRVLL